MGSLAGLRAIARGDVACDDLVAYGRAGSDAYDLIDSVPATGVARLAAWNAFVLQTYGDSLLAATISPRHAPEETAGFVRDLYIHVGEWLGRARAAASDGAYELDTTVPQPLPHIWESPLRTREQLTGMKTTFEAVQARVSSDVRALSGDDARNERLRRLMSSVDGTVDYVDKLWTRRPSDELRLTLGTTLQLGLDDAYELGQLIALPELLAQGHAPEPPRPSGSSALRIFLPGDAGFDPWCLTDPLDRRRFENVDLYKKEIDRLWAADPHPDQTLAIQSQIAVALEQGAVDYMPSEDFGDLARLADHCPWPGVLYVRVPLTIGGRRLEVGDKFVYTAGTDREAGEFRRAIVSISAKAVRELGPDPAQPDADLGALLPAFEQAGFDVFQGGA